MPRTKRILVTAVVLLLLPSAGYARAGTEDMAKVIHWCLNETVGTGRMPDACIELLSSRKLDDLKSLAHVLGLIDADGKFVPVTVWLSIGECLHAALLENFDAFDYPAIVGCITSAVEAYAPRAGE